jgi:hypothetical protein
MNKKFTIIQLDDNDKFAITDLFFEKIVPKLTRLNAKKGNINCDFAGEKYKNWTILFDSIGSDFEIIDFEYDEESSGMDLDL